MPCPAISSKTCSAVSQPSISSTFALTGIEEGESAELAEATEAVPGQEEAQATLTSWDTQSITKSNLEKAEGEPADRGRRR